MGNNFSLQSLYQQKVRCHSRSCLETEIQALLEGRSICLEAVLDSQSICDVPISEDQVIKNWKNLLVLTLLDYLSHTNSKDLANRVRAFAREPWNENSQYLRALVALNYFLVGLPVPDVNLYVLEGGAAPIELYEYCPWEILPYFPYHTEFGMLLCLLALLANREYLYPIVGRLARWQLNTLDSRFLPLSGLFLQEKDGAFVQNIVWAYLFFRGAAQLTGERIFQTVAEAQLQYIQQLAEQMEFSLSPLVVLIEKVLTGQAPVERTELQLPEQICDSSTALIGRRLNTQQVMCTLHGGHTGLGCFRIGEVEIISYGPQYLPLGECAGFGIEGNYLSDHGLRTPILQVKPQGFLLKGCVRLVDQPVTSPSSVQLGEFRGIWFEIEQELMDQQLHIRTNCLGLEESNLVAFSFFIKAEKCWVNTKTPLLPKTFNRYEGNPQPIVLESKQNSFKLQIQQASGMQVIPLGGGVNFWGADFLVAYLLNPNQNQYKWLITPFQSDGHA